MRSTAGARGYAEFFRRGTSEYHRATLAQVPALLDRFVAAALLDLANANLGQPERAEEFFNQSLLEDPTRSSGDDAPPAPAAQP